MTRIICVAAVLFAVWSARVPLAGGAQADGGPAAPLPVLRDAGFSPPEIRRVLAGEAVTRTLESDSREIAVAGAVRIKAPRAHLAQRFRGVDYLRRARSVLQVGEMSLPPRVADLLSVPFDAYDLDLRECRPGECRVRLSASDIATFHREVRWNETGWPERSAAVWRQVLASYASGYLTGRPPVFPVFANKDAPLNVADEQRVLRERFTFVEAFAPGVLRHLADPAGAPLAGATPSVYWSVEDFGVRPVLRIAYQVVLAPDAGAGGPGRAPFVVATNQIYAAHYLDAALGFVLSFEAPPGDAGGFYMVAVNRARTRSLSGFLRRMVRSTVQGRSRDALARILTSTKSALEAGAY